jgi:hypothetical protein
MFVAHTALKILKVDLEGGDVDMYQIQCDEDSENGSIVLKEVSSCGVTGI